MKVALVDDRILGAILRGTTPAALRRRPLATTGLWYVRLCRAVLGSSLISGQLSGPFDKLPAVERQRAIDALLSLPDDITLPCLRDLGPIVGRLQGRHSLNILQSEVLAAAEQLDADVFIATPSPQLEEALHTEHRKVTIIGI